MRLINLDDILKQFPKADFDGDDLENMKAYPHWKTDITGLFSILKSVPIIEPCEDAISRDALVNELKCGYWNKELQSAKNDTCVIDAMIDWSIRTVKSQPSVTPQTRWIPVSERLPEKQDCYLVTTKWKGSYSGDVYIETNMAVYREKPKEWDCVDVIAWMPLPQPYKDESEGEKNV